MCEGFEQVSVSRMGVRDKQVNAVLLWVRRGVVCGDGEIKDFLNKILPFEKDGSSE